MTVIPSVPRGMGKGEAALRTSQRDVGTCGFECALNTNVLADV